MMKATDKEIAVARAVISPKFQIVIPKEIRDRLELRPGQNVSLIEREGLITIVPQRPIRELRGLLKGADTTGYRDKTDRF
jgi:AbrB family looped-hinge helix DNA binding protein